MLVYHAVVVVKHKKYRLPPSLTETVSWRQTGKSDPTQAAESPPLLPGNTREEFNLTKLNCICNIKNTRI